MFKKPLLYTVLFSYLLTSASPIFASGSGSRLPQDSDAEKAAASMQQSSSVPQAQLEKLEDANVLPPYNWSS